MPLFPDLGVKAFKLARRSGKRPVHPILMSQVKHKARDDASSRVRREGGYAADRAEEGGGPEVFVACPGPNVGRRSDDWSHNGCVNFRCRGPVGPCLRVNLASRKPWNAEDRMPPPFVGEPAQAAFLCLRMQKSACYAGTWSTGGPLEPGVCRRRY